jgi:purine-binding chemotaxis protein CheW
VRHVVFQVEKEHYALPLESVREVVIPPSTFSRVPRSPRAVRGIMNLRGRVVTVVELKFLLEVLDQGLPSQKIVMLDRGRRYLGLLVTEVEGIDLLEKVIPAPGKRVAAIRGMARIKSRAVTVLDPEGVDGEVAGLFAK